MGVFFCVKCNTQVTEWIEFKGSDFCKTCRWQLKYLGAESAVLSSGVQSEPVSLVSRIRRLGSKTFVHYGAGDSDPDVLACVDTLSRLPEDMSALMSLGKVYQSKGRFQQAKAVMLDMVLYHSNHPAGYRELAALHYYLKEYDACIEVLLQLKNRFGTDPFVERNLKLAQEARDKEVRGKEARDKRPTDPPCDTV